MDPYVYNATVVSVHDGDTIKCDLDLGFSLRLRINVRLNGCNARELSEPGGKEARDHLRFLLVPGTPLQLHSVAWDKYGGRIDADVFSGETNLAARLITEQWAAAWGDSGARPLPPWPRTVGDNN